MSYCSCTLKRFSNLRTHLFCSLNLLSTHEVTFSTRFFFSNQLLSHDNFMKYFKPSKSHNMSSLSGTFPERVSVATDFDDLVDVLNEQAAKLDRYREKLIFRAERDPAKWGEIVICDPNFCKDFKIISKKVRWIQNSFAGVNPVMNGYLNFRKENPNFTSPSWKFTRFGGVLGPPAAEYVIAHIVSWSRNFPYHRSCQQKCEWVQKGMYPYRGIDKLTIGILGFGTLGQRVARACKHFSGSVWALKKSPVEEKDSPLSEIADKIVQLDELKTLLANVDIICNVLPSTPETVGLLNNQVLKNCSNRKPLFINIGRGDIISESSILEALNNEWISFASLDVFETEPLPSSSSLWKHPKILISPHVAAWSFSEDIANVFLENYELYKSDKPLKHLVDFEKGY